MIYKGFNVGTFWLSYRGKEQFVYFTIDLGYRWEWCETLNEVFSYIDSITSKSV